MGATWHIWVIKSGKYEKVKKHLESIPEIEEHFYPTTPKEFKRSNGSISKRRIPLYAGYLFVKYEYSPELYHKLNSFPFITTYVGPCPKKDFDKIESTLLLESINTGGLLSVDDRVRVVCGPFKGLEGLVVGVNANNADVSLTIFGRLVKSTFHRGDLEVIKVA